MKLPVPSQAYNAQHESQKNRILEQADQQNHKKNVDMRINFANDRFIILGEDGNEYRLYVNSSGVLSIAAI